MAARAENVLGTSDGIANGRNDKAPIIGALHISSLAVRVGFEPTIRFLVYTLSRRAPSTARTPHRVSTGLMSVEAR